MTPLSAASASQPAYDCLPGCLPGCGGARPRVAVAARTVATDVEEPAGVVGLTAARHEATDEIGARLHAYECLDCDPAAAHPDDEHWMAWSAQARAVLAGAHVHAHHHPGGRRLVIEIDLSDHTGMAV